MTGEVVAVSRSAERGVAKKPAPSIRLLAGLGVEGDIHAGATVQHLARIRKDPTKPNLRQVHLMHIELFDRLADGGIVVTAGAMGENVLTRGIDLLALPRGTRLHLGGSAVVEVTGLRNPCRQLDAVDERLLDAVLHRAGDGTVIRKSGVMSVVVHGGWVAAGDPIRVEPPAPPFLPLEPV